MFIWLRLKRFPSTKTFLFLVWVSGPLSVIALWSGWIVTEVGRQPWIVFNVMRTEDAVTSSPGVEWMFVGTLVIYSVLIFGAVSILRVLSRHPLPESEHAD